MRYPGEAPAQHLTLVLVGIFVIITVAASVDLVMDRPHSLWSVHVLAEVTLVGVSLGAASYLAWGWVGALREVRKLEGTVVERQAERDSWRDQAARVLRSMSEAMDAQFTSWGLTPAERETALMLLKGYSHKRIGRMTDRSERTIRQHSVAVYRKAGLSGRSELSAFFLEGLFLPEAAGGAGDP